MTSTQRKLAAILAPFALVCVAACGASAPLQPAAGNPAPAAPLGTSEGQTAEQLLELPTLAAPERSVELRRRSEEREDDPFDLPPDG